jgi:hypothetical protein
MRPVWSSMTAPYPAGPGLPREPPSQWAMRISVEDVELWGAELEGKSGLEFIGFSLPGEAVGMPLLPVVVVGRLLTNAFSRRLSDTQLSVNRDPLFWRTDVWRQTQFLLLHL